MKRFMKITGIALGILLGVLISFAWYNEIKPIVLGLHSPVFQSGGKALAGFDVVSYFQGSPVKGTDAYSVNYKETNWTFSSKANLEAFLKNPEKYVPQFGGYCSKAVSTGFTAPGDPGTYLVWQDKLYIFAGEEGKQEFLSNPEQTIAVCEQNWN